LTVDVDSKEEEQRILERLGENPLERSRDAQVIRDSVTYFDHSSPTRKARRPPSRKYGKAKKGKDEDSSIPIYSQPVPGPPEELVYRFLSTNGEASIGKIAKALRLDRKTVEAGLAALRKENRVRVVDLDWFDMIAAGLRRWFNPSRQV
jgi:hypothetical protein